MNLERLLASSKHPLACLFFSLFITTLLCGQENRINLEKVLELANQNSIDAFIAKRQFATKYWEYRSFGASQRPFVNLELQPLTYNRSFIKRYDPENNVDVYREQQNLNSFSQISISQTVMATGALLYMNSSFNRLVNYGTTTIENYNSTPIRIGITQPIMAFNELKWKNKTALLTYEKAKKEFISAQQEINLEAISLYFSWILARTKFYMQFENEKSANRLYKMGKKRYQLGSIEKDDLLNLELEVIKSRTESSLATQELNAAISDIQLFLDCDNLTDLIPELPELVPNVKIDTEAAKELAKINNPELLNAEIEEINAASDLDKTLKDNRFDLSVNASYGLNQQADEFAQVYSSFLDQQMFAIQFSMPLLDWGERKRKIKSAEMAKEIAELEVMQSKNDVFRQLELAIGNFNIQESLVITALKTKEISEESYHITEKRFLTGKSDLLRLINSRKAWQEASDGYVISLKNYWDNYYRIQKLTHFNFIDSTTLTEDFEELLKR